MMHYYVVWFGASSEAKDVTENVADIIADRVSKFEQYAPHRVINGVAPRWPGFSPVIPPGLPGSNEQRRLTYHLGCVCVKAHVLSDRSNVQALDMYIHISVKPPRLWLIEKVSELELMAQLLEKK